MNSGSIGGDGGTFDLSAGQRHDLHRRRRLQRLRFRRRRHGDRGPRHDAERRRSRAAGRAPTARAASSTSRPGLASDEGSSGNLLVQKNIVATSGASHGSGQSITLVGCGLTVAPNVKVDGTGGVNPISNLPGGSDIELISRRADAAPARFAVRRAAGRLGNMTTHLPGANPVIGANVVFNPNRIDNPIVNGPFTSLSRLRRRHPAIRRDVRQGRRRRRRVLQRDAATAFLCPTVTATPTLTASRTPTPSRTVTPPRTRQRRRRWKRPDRRRRTARPTPVGRRRRPSPVRRRRPRP